jgi:fibronectin-binding autotransporter adhesin
MWKLTHLKLRLPLAAAVLFAATAPALALDINLTFAPSVSDFGANTNSFTSAVAYAAQQFDNAITDPITVNITVNGSSGTSTFGASNTNYQGPYLYTSILNALTSNATDPAQQIAVANLPPNDPSPGGPNYYEVPNGEAKALGLLSANNGGNDGSVTFGTGVGNGSGSWSWAFNPTPNNLAVPNTYDFIGVAEHELSEAMGRVWGLGTGSDGRGFYVPFDLFRFDGGTNTRDMTNNTNIWFSINGGGTQLNSFNYAFTNSSGTDTEDPTDWGIGVANQNYQNSLTNDAFNAYSAGGVVNALSSADLTVLNVMGFHLSASAMSGGTWARNGNGSWSSGGNWTYPVVPSGITVYFAGVPVNPSAPITVTLDGNQSAAGLVFNVSNGIGYTLAQGSGGTLSLGTPAGGSITVVAGDHNISAPMTLQGPLTVNVPGGSTLLLTGAIGEANAGTSFTFNGAGLLNYGSVGTFTGNANVNSGTLWITSGGLLPAANENVGGSGASATVQQFAGINSVTNTLTLGANVGGSGSYSLSAGSLSANTEIIGSLAGGSFVQTGGTNSDSYYLDVGYGSTTTGSYTLQGGYLSAATREVVGYYGSGSFTQSAGINSPYVLDVGSYFPVVATGTFNMQGGSLSTTGIDIACGVFTQTAGTVQGTSATGLLLDSAPGAPLATYNLLGGRLSVDQEIIGFLYSGSFSQSGGIQTITNGLYLGYSSLGSGSGTLNLSGGSLYVDNVYVGLYHSGSFIQSGGTQTVTSALNLGYYPGSTGKYNLSGNGVLSANAEYIGYSGSGSFTQSGGTHSVSNTLALGYASSGNGSYSLGSGYLFALDGEYVGLSSPGSFTQSGGVHSVTDILTLGSNSGGNGSYLLSGGSLFVQDGENIGVSGSGSFTQSGGTNMAPPAIVVGDGGVASYSLSGGLVSTQELQVGGVKNGAFTQYGGSVLAGGGAAIALLVEGTTGTTPAAYNLQSGLLSVTGQEYLGELGIGSFVQSGGTHTISGGTLLLGTTIPGYNASGTYNLSAGNLSVPTEFIAYYGTGNFTQSGGNHSVTSALDLGYGTGSSGTYNLSGNGMLSANVEVIGLSGSGSFLQSGGAHYVFGLYLGFNAGSSGYYQQYLSSSSLLSAGTEFIGDFGTGNFQQSAGSNSVTSLAVGYQASGSGTYNQSGGTLSAGNEFIGYMGKGYFTQTGGVNNAAPLTLASVLGSSGTYTLGGGTLNCSQITAGQGASTFYFNGGVLIPSASSGNFMSGLTAAYVEYAGALINTNGQNITIAQPLLNGSGGGSLEKSGAGALTLAAANTFTNGAILYAGTLVAANTSGSALGSGPLVPDGGVLAAGPAGGTLLGNVQGGGPATYIIAPGADLATGQYTALNLLGGLTTNVYTTLKFDLNLATSTGSTGTNGRPIYGGDLVNLGGATLTVNGGDNQGGQITFAVNPTQSGDYQLFHDAGGSPNLSGFNLPSQSGWAYVLSSAVEPGYIDLIAAAAGVGASGGTWQSPTSGSWTTGGNWSTNPQVPTSGTVYFPGAPRTVFVTMDGGQSAGALVLSASGANGYTLQQGSGGALTLGTSNGGTITVTGGAQNISAPLVLQGNLTANVASGASMQLSGAVSQSTSGLGLTLNGPGLLIFSGTGAYSGNTTVNSGTLQINAGGSLPANNEYIGTGGAAAYVVQNGGNNTVPNGGNLQGLIVGYGSGNAYYNLNGGLLNAANEFISWSGYSVFTQTGGTNQAGYLSVGTFYNGNYYLSGGLVAASAEDINSSALNGAFTQSGGTNQTPSLIVGYLGGGAYYLSGTGLLSAANEYVGAATSGEFYQTGGTNAVGANLYVGLDQSRYGSTYVLAGSGLLTAPNEYVGYIGTGTFTQTGGTNSLPGGNLYLGYYSGGMGTYNLSGGVLDPLNEYVGVNGTGIFYQSGGVNTTTNVSVSGGYYLLTAGLLQGTGGGTIGVVNGGFQSPGTLDLSQFVAVSAGTGALLDLSGNVLNTGGVSLSVGSDSLLIVTPGFNPASYASYSNLGLTHTLGTTLTVSAGTGFGGWGTIADPVNCHGSIIATTGGWINLNNGLSLADPGQVNLGTGTVIVNDTNFSGMTGGALTASLMVVGSNGTGSFPQSGGTSVLPSLYLGYNAADNGTYLLSGTSQLSVGYEYVGYAGSGTFTQTGGTHAVGTLYLAEQYGSAGTYNLNGGLLSLSALYPYPGGAAAFNFGGGTLQAAAPLTISMPITLSMAGSNGVFDTNGNASTLVGPLSGPGGLIVAGSGSLTLAVSNNYTGTTLVCNGTLLLGDPNALSGSTFDTSGTGELSFEAGIGGFAFGGLQGSGSLLLTDNGSTDIALTVGLNNASTTFSGSLSDSNSGGSLTLVGTGTLTLTGTNTYGGGTFVEGGTLIVTNNEGLADGSSLFVGDAALFAPMIPSASAVSPVPEPGTWALLMASAALMAMYRNRGWRANCDRTGFGR